MQINSSSEQQLLQQIHYLINTNKINSAWNLCQELVDKYPKSPDAWMTNSFIAMRTGQLNIALTSIDKAIKLSPNRINFKLNKIMLLEQSGEIDSACRLGAQLLDRNVTEQAVLKSLAAFFNRAQRYELSEKCYRKLLVSEPNSQELLFNLANVNLFLGKIEEADSLATNALKGNELDCDIHFFRSHLKRQTSSSNHIKELEAFSQIPIKDPVRKAKVFYSLAKELEDCENFSESFRVRLAGAEVYRKNLNYDINEDLKFIRSTRQTYSADLFEQKATKNPINNTSDKPIFVVGLPRTGTTLLERIVSSHSRVSSAGELTHFNRLISAGMEKLKLDPKLSRSQMVSDSIKLDFAQLGQQYLEATKTLAGKKDHFIDKLPQNSLYIGLIHLALPNAKVLLLERHPLDVCYSVFKQLFTDAFHFSYDLEELADYYYEHQLLMEHWKSTLPGVVKTVRYEDLVHDLEQTAKSVIDYCGLEWEEECLEFHRNKQATTTASASQVRQKVYSSSIGMWKNYKQELKPLIDKLEAYGCLEGWDY